jgi:hypothetical protein
MKKNIDRIHSKYEDSAGKVRNIVVNFRYTGRDNGQKREVITDEINVV